MSKDPYVRSEFFLCNHGKTYAFCECLFCPVRNGWRDCAGSGMVGRDASRVGEERSEEMLEDDPS